MTFENPLLKMWRHKDIAFGMWSTIDSGLTAELIATERVDYVCCDQQHGVIDYAQTLAMFQAVRAGGSIPLTRVASKEPAAIMKSLDAGAAGIIVPMINSRREAEHVVQAFRYPPDGQRSYGPVRAGITAESTVCDDLASMACILMIETAEGLANAEDICAVPGVDAIYIGPADLSIALGLPPGFERPEPEFSTAVERIRAACEEHGVVAGIQCTNGEMAARYADLGFQMVTIGSDANLLRNAVRRELASARRSEAAAVVGGYA